MQRTLKKIALATFTALDYAVSAASAITTPEHAEHIDKLMQALELALHNLPNN